MILPNRVQFVDRPTINASTDSLTLASPVNGNGLILAVGIDGAGVTVSSITQTGVTWTLLHAHTGTSPGDTAERVEFWQALNVSGAGTTVTINLSGTSRFSWGVYEYHNLASASVLDQSADNDQAATGASGTVGPTSETVLNNEVWLGIMQMHGTGGVPGSTTWPSWSTPDSGFALVDQQGVGAGTSVINWRNTGFFEKITSAAGAASFSCTQTTATPGNAAVTITSTLICLKGIKSGHTLPLLGVGP